VTKTVVYNRRTYKLCPLCNGRYLVPDIKHLDSDKCMVESVDRIMRAGGWAKCGGSHVVIERAGIRTMRAVSSYRAGGEFSMCRWAPRWTTLVAALYHAPPPVRVWWLCKMNFMPEHQREALLDELRAVRALGGDVPYHCHQRLGVPGKTPEWWRVAMARHTHEALTTGGDGGQST